MLKNKTIFITGATAGFGKALAEKCADAGAKLVLTGRRTDRLEELQKSLGKKTTVHTLAFDVSDRAAVEKAITSLPKEFSAIDVLVNNAGLALGLEAAHETKLEDWEQMVNTNINGVLYCTHAILPGMVKRNNGHIVNLSSTAATVPYFGGNVYGASKAFITQFSKNLRTDILGKNIRVTNIEPGMAETEFSDIRFSGNKERADGVYAGVKPLSADDIADAIIWAISQPAHVNIGSIELWPTMQTGGGYLVHRS